jgi:hypothetical protein
MKVFMPMYSLGARGGFGLYFPGKKYRHPASYYPIGVHLPVVLDPYFHWYGYYYQLRRTWHGIVWAAQKYVKHSDPKTTKQLNWRQVFADGMSIWQGMSSQTKDIYEKWKFPTHMSGMNRFLHYYLREHYPPVVYYLLLETGDKILLEDGFKIKLE